MRVCVHFIVLILLVVSILSACSCTSDDDDSSGGSNPADDDTSDDTTDDTGNDHDDGYVYRPFNTTPPPWPEWVLRHWVWEDESTQESATAYVNDYLANDIPVGAIIIDSPWETGYNTFVFDTNLFPDAQAMIDGFHEKDVRVFMWITANVNEDSPNFQEGKDAGYYVYGGKTLEWWKGDGAFIDYWNPDALEWWHGQMDKALDLGIDGWKTDGSDFSLYLWLFVPTFAGTKTVHEYQEAYYTDFFEYTREVLGNDRVISARPVDSYGIPWGPNFAPIDVNFAGWVGDQDPNYTGLRCALLNMFMSGQRGYVNFGSDIGGYRETDLTDGMRERKLFVRWAQFGAMSPIMENGGGGEHRPWMYDEEVLTIYRDYVKLHHALIPYLYSQGASSYAQRLSLFRPVHREWWEYNLGESLFIAPMVENGTTREVHFPEGTWINYFTEEEFSGDTTAVVDVPLEQFPIFVRKGAIIPMDIRTGGVFDDLITETAPYTVSLYPDGGEHEFLVFEEGGTGGFIRYTHEGSTLAIGLSATQRGYAFRVHGVEAPSAVTAEPAGALTEAASLAALSEAAMGYVYLADEKELWIKPGDASLGVRVTVE